MIIRQTAMESEEGYFDLELQRKQMLLIFEARFRKIEQKCFNIEEKGIKRDQRSVNGGCISGRRRPRGEGFTVDFLWIFFSFSQTQKQLLGLWAFNCLSLR